MRVPFYKSLDREFELFGVKGRWVTMVLLGAGISLALGIIVGNISSSIIGIGTVVVGIVVVFFGVITIQVKVPSRQINKVLLKKKASVWVIRRETLCRILLEDPVSEEVRKYLSEKKHERA